MTYRICAGCSRLWECVHVVRVVALGALLYWQAFSFAEEGHWQFYSIPEGKAHKTLKMVAEQGKVDLVAMRKVTRGVSTSSLEGHFEVREAFARLLEDTPLVVVYRSEIEAYTVVPRSRVPSVSESQSDEANTEMIQNMNDIRKLMKQLTQSAAALGVVASGQIARAQDDAAEDVYELSPFEINAGDDAGYVAAGTLAGSRLKTSLVDTPASISVMTREFLDDIAASDVSDAIEYGLSASTDIGGGGSQVGASTGNGIVGNEFNFQIRGYRNVAATRDYFPTQLASDMFNVERVEVARGPNSLIFGVGGPGGIVNTDFKTAGIGSAFTNLRLQFGSYGEQRYSLDMNRTLVEGVLGARVNLMHQDVDGWKDFARNDQFRGALSLAYQATEKTKIKLNVETGDMEQNRVRPWGPVDQISSWQNQGSFYVPYGTPESPAVAGDSNYSQVRVASGGSPANGLTADIPAGQTFERRSAHLGTPTVLMMDGPLAGKQIWVGSRNEGKRYYRTSYSNSVPGFNTPGFITDESLFPTTGNLLGPGAVNSTDYLTTSATFDHKVGDNLNLNLTVARTDINRRQNSISGFAGITFKYDVTTTLPVFNTDGTYAATEGGPGTGQGTGALNFDQVIPNPYVGDLIMRYSPTYTLRDQLQDDIRFSANYNLDLERAGKHRILGFFQRSETGSESERFAETNVSPNRVRTNTWFNSNNYTGRAVHVDPFSPNLLERGVPDPWSNPIPNTILYGSDGNYEFEAGWIRNNLTKSETVIDSTAIALQSEFFSGSLITTLGGRRDEVSISNWSRIRDSLGEATGLNDPTAPQTEKGDTYSAGFVYDIPAVEWLNIYGNKSTNFQPQGGAQLFEDEALLPDREIGALKGEGIDYGLKVNMLGGKAYATLGRFDVSQQNASTGFDGNVRGYINAIWTTVLNGGSNTVVTDADDPNGHRVGGRETRDQSATGWEFEVTANPTESWRITFNVSKSDNAVAELGNNVLAYVDKHRSEWEQLRSTPYDTGRTPGFLGNNTVGDLIDGLDNIINFMKAGEGVPEVNIRPWNANLFTAYRVREGALSGLTFGAGANYRGEQILGINPATLDDPVAEVFKGNAYAVANGMIGYQFKWKETDVRLQLNIDNLLQNDDLQTLASQYDVATGSLTPFYYNLEPRSYTVSAKFSF